MELILALALATVVLGLVAMAIHMQLTGIDRSRATVEEAQLARALLQRISDDIRNAVPFAPVSPSASVERASSAVQGDMTDAANAADPVTTPTTSAKSYSGGLYGGLRALQVDTNRRPRVVQSSTADGTQSAHLSDVRTVTYSLGNPGSDDPVVRNSTSDSEGGLYRREMDRADHNWATRQGDTASLAQATEVLASEVADMEFTYFDGPMAYEQWDSTEQGNLPHAVRVALAIRRPSPPGFLGLRGMESPSRTVYAVLVELPNSHVASSKSRAQTLQRSVPKSDAKGP